VVPSFLCSTTSLSNIISAMNPRKMQGTAHENSPLLQDEENRRGGDGQVCAVPQIALQILIDMYSLLNFQKKMRETRGLGRNGKSFPTLQ
jgi:hypothetical protein